jgi:hypothetical protein
MRAAIALTIMISSSALLLSSCHDDDDDVFFDEVTDLVGLVLLPDGVTPAAGTLVEIVFFGSVHATDATAFDGTFEIDDWPEVWEPLFAEAFFVDPLTQIEYSGVSAVVNTASSGDTDLGVIVMVQTVTASGDGSSLDLPLMVADDLDLDGAVDFAVHDPISRTTSIYRNAGDGTFPSVVIVDR